MCYFYNCLYITDVLDYLRRDKNMQSFVYEVSLVLYINAYFEQKMITYRRTTKTLTIETEYELEVKIIQS